MKTPNDTLNLPKCIWLTGLSGAGKTTIAQAVQERLQAQGHLVYVLDGDLLRHGLNRDLGFSNQDRSENTRRVAEVARMMVDAGVTVLVALISPFEADRRKARALFNEGQFAEVFVDAPLLVCMRRDVKGLYAKAQQGGVPSMTGLGSPYELPTQPDLRLETGVDTLGNCVEKVLAILNS
ncbi:MAG: adenylyl-sulfate kinase [Limnohabitans sp.]